MTSLSHASTCLFLTLCLVFLLFVSPSPQTGVEANVDEHAGFVGQGEGSEHIANSFQTLSRAESSPDATWKTSGMAQENAHPVNIAASLPQDLVQLSSPSFEESSHRRNVHVLGPVLRNELPVFSAVGKDVEKGLSSPFNNKLGTQVQYQKVCLGHFYFLALDADGNLYFNGVLNNNLEGSYLSQVSNLDVKITDIACGPRHMVAIGNGKVFVNGENPHSAIGNPFHKFAFDFIPLASELSFRKIATNAMSTLLLSEDGRTLFSVGTGYHGHSNETQVEKFPAIVLIETDPILDIAMSNFTSYYVDNNHCLYYWGQFPLNESRVSATPTRVPLDADGTLLQCTVSQISANSHNAQLNHLVIVMENGEVWGLGGLGLLEYPYPARIPDVSVSLPLQSLYSSSLTVFMRDSNNQSLFHDFSIFEGFMDFINLYGYSQKFFSVSHKQIAYSNFFSISIDQHGYLQALGRNARKRTGLDESYIWLNKWTYVEVSFVPEEYKLSHLILSQESRCELSLFGEMGTTKTFDIIPCKPSHTLDVRTTLGGGFLFYHTVSDKHLLRFNSSDSTHTRLLESMMQVKDLDNRLEIGHFQQADYYYGFYLDSRNHMRLISFLNITDGGMNSVFNMTSILPSDVASITSISHFQQKYTSYTIHTFFLITHNGRQISILRTADLSCFFEPTPSCNSIPELEFKPYIFLDSARIASPGEKYVKILSIPGDCFVLTSEGKIHRFLYNLEVSDQLYQVPFDHSKVEGKIVSLQHNFDGANSKSSSEEIVERILNTMYALITDQQKVYFWGSARNLIDPDCGLSRSGCHNAVVNTSSIKNNPEEFFWEPMILERSDVNVSGVTLLEYGAFLFENIKCGDYHRDDYRVCSGRGICMNENCACYFGSGSANPPYLCQYNYKCHDQFPDDMFVCSGHGSCLPNEFGKGYCECSWPWRGSRCEGNVLGLALVIVVSVMFICLFTLGSAFIFVLCTTMCLQRKRIQEQHIVETLKRQLNAIDSVETLPPLVDLFMIDFSRINLVSCIAESGDSVIWKALLKDRGVVAIKFFSPDFGNNSREEDAYNEGKILCGFDHPNIIQFHGFTVRQKTHIGIVMEFAEGGALSNYIRNSPRPHLTEILNILIDICTGMAVLHTRGIIHRDMKPQNVLIQLKPHRQYKICDFGFAKKDNTMSPHQTTGVYGTSYYIAPEVFRREGFTPSSDVYSFGIMLWEILCWQLNPYHKVMRERGMSLIDVCQEASVDASFRPSANDIFDSMPGLHWVAEIYQSCVDHNPNLRPTFLELRSQFKAKRNRIATTTYSRTFLSSSFPDNSAFRLSTSASESDHYYPLLDFSKDI